MIDSILMIIISCTITFFMSTILGFLLAKLKSYKGNNDKHKENENLQNKALQTLLRNQLTNIYFVYSELKQIPDYVYQNFIEMLLVYESLDGDGFIHTLARKMESWDVIKTGILNIDNKA